ncbi:PREDICTED: uncharacterized protein LOC109166771 [Ipomoea nil]|uniref:uncharacterized protein LOC109166771 n=1 Tax=Ipomoea nil TaxID=35883 RepID=UPI0009019AD7|nr:PREDICTED: uncharacterized protein LOC109166771 [Ipomoea nil]
MMHKHYFEALDKTMRDLFRFVNPSSATNTFGGKIVVLGGDFRQILPVIPKCTRVLRLTKNLRLNNMEPGLEMQQVEEFTNWIDLIDDGTFGCSNDDCAEVDIPQEMLLPSTSDPISTIMESTFMMFKNGDCDNNFLESRAILAPTLHVVNSINDYMSNMHIVETGYT